MQFQVPQFIEVEDKIFGPLTFRQFVYLAGGAGLAYLLWRLLPHFVAAPIAALIVGGAVALAFFKFNGRPFIVALEHGFYYLLHPKLYLWNNEVRSREAGRAPGDVPPPSADVYVPHLSDSKLHELAWSLDIKERVQAGFADDRDREQLRRGGAIRTSSDAMI